MHFKHRVKINQSGCYLYQHQNKWEWYKHLADQGYISNYGIWPENMSLILINTSKFSLDSRYVLLFDNKE